MEVKYIKIFSIDPPGNSLIGTNIRPKRIFENWHGSKNENKSKTTRKLEKSNNQSIIHRIYVIYYIFCSFFLTLKLPFFSSKKNQQLQNSEIFKQIQSWETQFMLFYFTFVYSRLTKRIYFSYSLPQGFAIFPMFLVSYTGFCHLPQFFWHQERGIKYLCARFCGHRLLLLPLFPPPLTPTSASLTPPRLPSPPLLLWRKSLCARFCR